MQTQQEIKQLILDNLWKFVIDGRFHSKNDPLIFDKARDNHPGEKGYLCAMEKAMKQMLNTLDEPLTIDYLENLHRITLESVDAYTGDDLAEHSQEQKIRDNPLAVPLIANKNISYLGFAELIYVNNALAKVRTSQFKSTSSMTPKKLFDEISIHELHRGDIIEDKDQKKAIRNFLTEKLEALIKQYYKDIRLAKHNTKKQIEAIVRFVHQAAVLHPFFDGNTRLFTFLIANKLLMQNNLPPALFDNPNYFDCYSHIELCNQLVSGMEEALKLGDSSLKKNWKKLDSYKNYFKKEEKKHIKRLEKSKAMEKPFQFVSAPQSFFSKPDNKPEAFLQEQQSTLGH